MELFSCPRRVTTGNGIASVHDSGGERVLFVDLRGRRRRALGSDIGCDGRSHPGRARSRPRRGEPTGRVGTGIDHERIFLESFEALHADPDTAAVAFVVDLTRQGKPYEEGYLRVAATCSPAPPFRVVSNLESAIAPEEAAILRDGGIPVLRTSRPGCARCATCSTIALCERARSARPPSAGGRGQGRWRARLTSGEPADEVEGLSSSLPTAFP